MEKEIGYYKRAYDKVFQSRVVSCIAVKKGYEVVLEDTLFYPEGGGQPSDKGILGGQIVLDVQEREGKVYHSVKEELRIGSMVTGEIDWDYRFDLMQNHTGEHIVSGIAHQKYGVHNVGFHMGKDVITLDFDGKLSFADVMVLEEEANNAVMENLPVKVWYPTPKELERMTYRSKKKLEGLVRIVEVPDYDRCACCGIHTATTGEIGCIKILSMEQKKGGVRLSMVAGKRALSDYRLKCQNADTISRMLSIPPNQIAQAVEKLKKERDTLQWQKNALERERLEKILQHVPQGAKFWIVFETPVHNKTAQQFVESLCKKVDTAIAFFGEETTGYHYILMSRHEDMKVLGQKLVAAFSGQGGGTTTMSQGKLQGKREEIQVFLDKTLGKTCEKK